MHPYLRHAYELLLEGPLGIPGLCDLVTDYAKCLIGHAPRGSTFLIVGKRQAGKTTLLRDLLHRRESSYRYGEIRTDVDTSDVGTIPMMHKIQHADHLVVTAQCNSVVMQLDQCADCRQGFDFEGSSPFELCTIIQDYEQRSLSRPRFAERVPDSGHHLILSAQH